MHLDDLNVLAAFLAVAEERSFTRAAKRLGLSRSALSYSVRRLEERIGVRLLARTTRSVAPTEAGEQLISHLSPALADVGAVLERIAGLRARPAGTVRVVAPRLAVKMLLGPKLEQFARGYPEVVLHITTDDSPLDLVAGRFDAGIHLGEFIERDMIAVRVSRDQRAAIVGSPRYFETHPKPTSPRDLPGHRCINIRMGSAGVYPVGVRQRRRVAGRRRERPFDHRRHGHDDPCGDGWDRTGLLARRVPGAAARERRTRPCAGGLVPAVRGVLPLLPQSTPAAGRTGCTHRDASSLARRAEDLALHVTTRLAPSPRRTNRGDILETRPKEVPQPGHAVVRGALSEPLPEGIPASCGQAVSHSQYTTYSMVGGERGIRTLGRVSPTHAFQACAFNHSAISPRVAESAV